MYLFDTNVLIQSQNTFYSKNICPGFWNWLIREHRKGNLKSISQVREEFTPDDPDLAEWLTENKSLFDFEAPTAALIQAYQRLSRWANSRDCRDSAKAKFLNGTDYHLVAYSLAGKMSLITFEKPEPKSQTKIKIPDACDAVGVQYVNLFHVLRQSKAVFQLI